MEKNVELDKINEIKIEITAEIGKTQITIEELLNIKNGKIMSFNKNKDDPFLIYANGKLIAEGEIVTINDTLGIKITKVY